jgi:hypothetical protein
MVIDTCCPEAQNTSVDHRGRVRSLSDMLKVNAEQFVEAARYLAVLREISERVARSEQTQGLDRPLTALAREASGLDQRLNELRAQCDSLDMRFTIKHIDRCLNESELKPQHLIAYSVEIYDRFRDELAERRFYSLTPRDATWFEDPLKGWESVIDRFGCSFDVEEARKCIALERYTAAVFHLMKVVEAAVLELQIFLKDKDVKANFGAVVTKLEDMTQKQRFEHIKDDLKPYLPVIRDVLTQLHAVKDSWRNKVSHVDVLVPADTFTEELARGVHDATLLLMKKLAAGLPAPDIQSPRGEVPPQMKRDATLGK